MEHTWTCLIVRFLIWILCYTKVGSETIKSFTFLRICLVFTHIKPVESVNICSVCFIFTWIEIKINKSTYLRFYFSFMFFLIMKFSNGSCNGLKIPKIYRKTLIKIFVISKIATILKLPIHFCDNPILLKPKCVWWAFWQIVNKQLQKNPKSNPAFSIAFWPYQRQNAVSEIQPFEVPFRQSLIAGHSSHVKSHASSYNEWFLWNNLFHHHHFKVS